MKNIIYLDYHATTPCDPQVIQAMIPYFGESFGNPSSSLHQMGRKAAEAAEKARTQVAELIGADSREIIFTGGATESNNLALFGIASSSREKRNRIVTTAIEHKSVLGPCKELQKQGFEVVILPVSRDAQIDIDIVNDTITSDTLIVSVQAANNEVGTIQPIKQIATIAHEKGALVHCDAAQAIGKIPVDVATWDVDLLSISAHKLYGPKGVGATYIRGGPYALSIRPLLFGGGQEYDLRSGTLNVPGIVGFGKACQLCTERLLDESLYIANLRNKLEEQLLCSLPSVHRNGALDCRLPGNSSLTFPGIDAEVLIVNVPELAISTGSACTSGALEPSHVLTAMRMSRSAAYSTIRIGIGRFTTEDEINRSVIMITDAAKRLMDANETGLNNGLRSVL
jgi:cysteine desulfurase